jgi:Nose resistant-to-fluoxetine protein, N-terminal domain
VFDSSSKIPGDGIIDATFLTQVGNFDQCLATSGPKDANNEPKFTGKYCIFQPGFQGTQIEMMNETISSALKIQSLMQQTLVRIIFTNMII